MLSSLLLLISLSLAFKFNQFLLQNIMSHPVHDANETSSYGDLTREEFYKNHHQILHKESFMLNQQNMKIFTQSWRPYSTLQLKGLVAMVHGYKSESSWLFELTCRGHSQSWIPCLCNRPPRPWLFRWLAWSHPQH